MMEWSCAFCGHQHLGRPVFVSNGGNPVAAGSGCAAIAVYGETAGPHRAADVKRRSDDLAYEVKVEEQLREERKENYQAAAADLAADRETPYVQQSRKTYHSIVRTRWGGQNKMTYPDFVKYVAETGDLPS